jgi:hypothetical protein
MFFQLEHAIIDQLYKPFVPDLMIVYVMSIYSILEFERALKKKASSLYI